MSRHETLHCSIPFREHSEPGITVLVTIKALVAYGVGGWEMGLREFTRVTEILCLNLGGN